MYDFPRHLPTHRGTLHRMFALVFTSGVAAFMQRAALTALEEGEDFTSAQLRRAREGRELVCSALRGSKSRFGQWR